MQSGKRPSSSWRGSRRARPGRSRRILQFRIANFRVVTTSRPEPGSPGTTSSTSSRSVENWVRYCFRSYHSGKKHFLPLWVIIFELTNENAFHRAIIWLTFVVGTSATRFCEISPLWQKFKSFGYFWYGLIIIWQTFKPTLAIVYATG